MAELVGDPLVPLRVRVIQVEQFHCWEMKHMIAEEHNRIDEDQHKGCLASGCGQQCGFAWMSKRRRRGGGYVRMLVMLWK